jgi:hypothetical protein
LAHTVHTYERTNLRFLRTKIGKELRNLNYCDTKLGDFKTIPMAEEASLMVEDGLLEPLEPTIENLLQQKSLWWIFVGSKVAVGKTTCSCSIAVQLSRVRESVLIISTDSAHNIFDASTRSLPRFPRRLGASTTCRPWRSAPTSASTICRRNTLRGRATLGGRRGEVRHSGFI